MSSLPSNDRYRVPLATSHSRAMSSMVVASRPRIVKSDCAASRIASRRSSLRRSRRAVPASGAVGASVLTIGQILTHGQRAWQGSVPDVTRARRRAPTARPAPGAIAGRWPSRWCPRRGTSTRIVLRSVAESLVPSPAVCDRLGRVQSRVGSGVVWAGPGCPTVRDLQVGLGPGSVADPWGPAPAVGDRIVSAQSRIGSRNVGASSSVIQRPTYSAPVSGKWPV